MDKPKLKEKIIFVLDLVDEIVQERTIKDSDLDIIKTVLLQKAIENETIECGEVVE